MRDFRVDYVCPQAEILLVESSSVIAQSEGTDNSIPGSLQGFVINEEIDF